MQAGEALGVLEHGVMFEKAKKRKTAEAVGEIEGAIYLALKVRG